MKQQLLDDVRLGDTAQERYNSVFKGGLQIYTTFDPRLQQFALQARNDQLPDTGGKFTVALVALDPQTGRGPGDGRWSGLRERQVQPGDAGHPPARLVDEDVRARRRARGRGATH